MPAKGVLLIAAMAALSTTIARADPVRLQLKWHHQFQFAGYYAAEAKGYYAAEGLDVRILEGGAGDPPIASVLGGRAEFGVGDADVLLYAYGAPPEAGGAEFLDSAV